MKASVQMTLSLLGNVNDDHEVGTGIKKHEAYIRDWKNTKFNHILLQKCKSIWVDI